MNSSMFSLGQRLSEKLSIDFSGFSEYAGMYSRMIPIAGKEKNAITNLITSNPPPFKINEYFTDPHLTVIWSRLALTRSDILSVCPRSRRFDAAVTGVSYWEGHNRVGYVVLNIESSDIHELHELLLKLGAKHSFETFEQHITIATGVGALNPEIRNWMGVINERLWQRPLPIQLSSLSFSDLFD